MDTLPPATAPGAAPVPWWRDRDGRNRVAIVVFAAIVLGAMLFTGFTILTRGDQRVLVVTMEQTAGQAERDALKAACGRLPGVRLESDRGNPDPRVQGRFTVRFLIGGSTQQQEAALQACINEQPGVRGFLNERDAR